jgi:hypothetical protein
MPMKLRNEAMLRRMGNDTAHEVQLAARLNAQSDRQVADRNGSGQLQRAFHGGVAAVEHGSIPFVEVHSDVDELIEGDASCLTHDLSDSTRGVLR